MGNIREVRQMFTKNNTCFGKINIKTDLIGDDCKAPYAKYRDTLRSVRKKLVTVPQKGAYFFWIPIASA
ncbi:MAG: hypothetical protein FVQ80_02090 [Planctomycetes bacterium]|nr:hypothetical protein [Planctomycetota bacterium]